VLDDGPPRDGSTEGVSDGPGAPAEESDGDLSASSDGEATGEGSLGGPTLSDASDEFEETSSTAAEATVASGPDGTASGPPDATVPESSVAGDGGSDASVDGTVGGDGPGPVVDAPSGDAGACDPTMPFGAPALMTSLESASKDGNLRLMPDELTGFFWSTRDDGGVADLYTTTRAAAASAFGNITLLNNVNSTASQYDPTVTADGLTLAFRSDRAGGSGGDDLYWASRAAIGTDFSGVGAITSLNSTANDVQPFLLAGGGEIYFSSNRSGDYDLYRAMGNGGSYSAPTPVQELNSATASDQNPVGSADDLTIVFSSDRPGGAGKQDIWIATRSSLATTFGAPSDLAGVNTAGNDSPAWLSVDGCRLYLQSDVSGSTHIYVSTRPP
jgi:hypothetical protein